MSKISITPNATGTGVFTISSPATNTDRTLTLPDEAGTVLTSASTANFPAGSVLQVKSVTKTDTWSSAITTNSVEAITGLSVAITPISTSSKILIMFNVAGSTGMSFREHGIAIQLGRDGAPISIGDADGVRGRVTTMDSVGASASDVNQTASIAGTHLDSPASISEITYAVYAYNASSSTQTTYVNRTTGDANNAQYRNRSTSTITVMEIAG